MQRLSLCFIFLLVTFRALAIDAVVSHTVFYRPDSTQKGKMVPYVEISWQVNPNTLHYTTNPDKTISARISTIITLSNQSGVINKDEYILQTIPVERIGQVMQHSIIGLRKYNVPNGTVTLHFELTDVADSTNRFRFSDNFNVKAPAKRFFISGLQLLDTAYQSSAQTPFWKNGRQHVPLSTNFLDDKRKMFYYYAEVYNDGTAQPADYPLIQKVLISKSETEGFYGGMIKTDTITSQAGAVPVLGKFDISSLPSGNYYLRMTLENRSQGELASESFFFQRLNKHPAETMTDTAKIKAAAAADTGVENVTVLNLKKTFVGKYSLAQIRGILKMLLPFSDAAATKTINGFLKKPDEVYMRYYIYNYFAAINKDDPGKAWKEFADKIMDVNKRFTEGSTPGYETERGFIYLRYGQPTDIISVENEQGSLPYEIWQYNTLKQMNKKDVPDAVFLFYRPNEVFNNYKLLHSTVEGEIQTPQWRSYLYTNTQGGSNMNSRAEQYLGNR